MTQAKSNGLHSRLETTTTVKTTITTASPSTKTATHANNVGGRQHAAHEKPGAAVAERCHPTVYVVFGSLLLDLLAFTMILPLLPSLLEHYRQADGSDGLYGWLAASVRSFQQLVGAPERYNSVLFGGALGSMYSFLQFVASPLMGGLSDVYGRKPVMLVCLVGIASSYALWVFAHSFGLFVLARFVGGLSKGNISLGMSIITDVSTTATRGRAMALVGIAFSLGFIVGPMIGAGFAAYADRQSATWFAVPAAFALLLAVGDVLFVACALRESLPTERRRAAGSLEASMAHTWRSYVSVPALFRFDAVRALRQREAGELRRLGLIYFVYLFVYSGLEFTVTFLMYHKFGYTSIDQAKMFLTTGVVMTVLQGGVVRRLPDARTKAAAVMGLLLIVPAFVLVGLAESGVMLYAGMILFAISTAFVVTCMTTLVSKYGNADQKGTVLGIYRSLGALARALGPIVASISFWCIGSSYTYILGGLLLLVPTLMLHRTSIQEKQQ